MEDISIKVKNYMCFGDAPQGFECIKPINILIGRNNSGKSALVTIQPNPTITSISIWDAFTMGFS